MKKLLLAVVLFAVFASATGSAALVDDLEVAVGEYNNLSGDVPSVVNTLFGNEVGKLTVDMNNDSMLYLKIVTEDSVIVEFEEIAADDDIGATLLVTTDETTLSNLLGSSSPLETFLDAYDNGKITIEAVGVVDKISLTLGNLAIKLSQLLGFI